VSVGAWGTDCQSSTSSGWETVDVATLHSDFDVVLLATAASLHETFPSPAGPCARRPPSDGVPDGDKPGHRRVPRRPSHRCRRQGRGDHRWWRHRYGLRGDGAPPGARSAHQLEILPAPPIVRNEEDPWPSWRKILRAYVAHEEGGERLFSVSTAEPIADETGRVRALRADQVRPVTSTTERTTFGPIAGVTLELRCELVLLALRFTGPEPLGVVFDLDLALTSRGTVVTDSRWQTNVEGVFSRGDMAQGQSLVAWATAEGRVAAAAVDRHLMGTSASRPRPRSSSAAPSAATRR